MKLRKPTDKEQVWIGGLEDRSTSSLSLLMTIDGKRVAVWLTRPLTDDGITDDAILDKAAEALMSAVADNSFT